MEFEVASVKENKSGPPPAHPEISNIRLDGRDLFSPTGGLFSVKNYRLSFFIEFAYKLPGYQVVASLPPQLRKWTNLGRFDIEARSSGDLKLVSLA